MGTSLRPKGGGWKPTSATRYSCGLTTTPARQSGAPPRSGWSCQAPAPSGRLVPSGAGTWPARPSLRLGHVGGLLARMEFAPTAFAREVALLYRNSYQRGVSVGFKPLAYEERRHEATGKLLGIRFLEQELLEVSAVPVPANRNALRRGQTPEVEGLGATPDELWPELAARVDRLDRTVAELAQLLSPAGATPVSGSRQEEIGAVLEALRGREVVATGQFLPYWERRSEGEATFGHDKRKEERMTLANQDLELIKREVAGIREFYQSRMDSEIPPLKEEVQRVAAQVRQVQDLYREGEKQAMLNRFGPEQRPRVPYGKYQGMDALDLAYIRSVLGAQLREPSGLNPRMLQDWQTNLKAAMDSTTAGSGDELVPTQEAAALWADVNLETLIAPLFSRVDMPSNPFEIPLQLGDVNWYPGTENLAVTNTALSTARQTLTAYELVAEVPWSLSLDEDSVIAMSSEVRSSLVRNAVEVIDDVLLNADTTTRNNINADGATISSSDAGKAQWLLGFDGLLHLPLVDNATQRNNHQAAVSDDMFNEVRGKLGKYGVRPSELAYIMDVNTYIRSLGVDNFRTLDKLGPEATLLRGQLGSVEGIPVIVSEQMALADADGKVTDAGNTANTGRVLIVNRSQWRLGFRREMLIETTRDIQKRQNIMVISMRLAFMERSGSRSTATHTALQYNITGVA